MNANIVLWAVKLEGRRLLKNGTGAPTVWTKKTQAENRAKKITMDRGTEAEAVSVTVRIIEEIA
jgi:hypothetical protein